MLKIYHGQNISTRNLLQQVFACEGVRNSKVLHSKTGKPYLASGEIFFSLSDCDGHTVCAVSDHEIGIDIQKIDYRPRIIKRFFTQAEQAYCHSPEDFTIIWTRKESFIKANGQGLSYGLKNVNALDPEIAKTWRFDDFYISICYNKT